MAAGSEMRVGDAEREAAASELREHFASGRLDQDELNERLDRAFAARTRGDLNALFTDLPSSWRSPSSAFGPSATGGSGADDRWQYAGSQSGSWQPGRQAGAGIAMLLFLTPVLLVFGVLSVFGIGGGSRPIGIVLILAAFALLRRLLFLILGRRGRGGRGGRRGGGRGGRGGGGPRRGRR
jgi:hypothetical protein